MQPIFLREALPELAAELEQLLLAEGKTELAQKLPLLQIVSRCGCPDGYCSTFHTRGGGEQACDPIPYTIALEPTNGIMSVDVVSGTIISIEVLYRLDVEEKLASLMPQSKGKTRS